MAITLTPQPLSAESFAPFGEVIETGGHQPIMINEGSTQRFDALARVQLDSADDYAAISIFRAEGRKLPFKVRMMERHPLGSQAFFPLQYAPYLVLVTAGDAAPAPDTLQLFIAQGNQGVNYYTGTWHHPLLALHDNADFLVVDRKGTGSNCDEVAFAAGTQIIIPELPEANQG